MKERYDNDTKEQLLVTTTQLQEVQNSLWESYRRLEKKNLDAGSQIEKLIQACLTYPMKKLLAEASKQQEREQLVLYELARHVRKLQIIAHNYEEAERKNLDVLTNN